jgi:hypothetical protein
MMKRREFLRRCAASAAMVYAAPLGGCADSDHAQSLPEDSVAHLLPTVSSDRLLIKASFRNAQEVAPTLRVDGRRVAGQMTDTHGQFWVFDADGLAPSRRYTLEIRRGRQPLIEPWSLATFPAPDALPERFRLLAYACCGGHDLFPLYVPLPVRQRLIRRALSFGPDAVIANGDQVYWDLRAGLAALVTGASPQGRAYAGTFDRGAPVLGHPNEDVLRRAVDQQIAGLYGTMFRSVPVFFLRDDHDYFEDDQVTEDLITFPPDDFMRRLARATQWLYYPEFLPDVERPLLLPGTGASDRPRAVSEAFGTLRFGRLFEGLLYDCKGFVTLDGDSGTVVPPAVESWLRARMADPTIRHVVNCPSNPPGWSAGKFAEWYPDVLGNDGRLTTDLPKPGWQAGWRAQHDRLLAAAAAMPRVPLFVSGDIHGVAEGLIVRSGADDLRGNPVVSLISGTPGTAVGWPSVARGTLATPPAALELEPVVPVQEVNGFHLIDFEPDRVTIRHFRWRDGVDSEDSIDTLEPFHVSSYDASS